MRRIVPWLPELALLVVAVLLRVTMVTRFDPARGYDFPAHWKYVAWMTTHHVLPDAGYSRATYHPPLYYAAIGALRRLGLPDARIGLLSVLAGCLRLGLFAVGLAALFPRRRLARVAALAVAAVLPASVHLDGMINPEAWLGLATAALLGCAYVAFARSGRARLGWCLAAALCASLALLTKISALVAIGAVGIAALVEAARGDEGWRARLARLAPFVAALGLVAALTGWYFARNLRLYGKPLLWGCYDYGQRAKMAAVERVPLWKRRDVGYVLGWTGDIYRRPMWPAGYQPTPRFWPLVVATTFADYYRYGFAPERAWNDERPGKPHHEVWDLARLSIAAGTLIAAVTAAAWLGALAVAWRRRRAGELALLLAPLCAVAGQLWFAWRFPLDEQGPVKGVYLQFAALPLCALFGIGVDWIWRRRGGWRALAAAALVAVACVATYTVYGRLHQPEVRVADARPS